VKSAAVPGSSSMKNSTLATCDVVTEFVSSRSWISSPGAVFVAHAVTAKRNPHAVKPLWSGLVTISS
jgi:hypothetical protein